MAVEACTGSGKTLAFVLPVVEILARMETPLSKHQASPNHTHFARSLAATPLPLCVRRRPHGGSRDAPPRTPRWALQHASLARGTDFEYLFVLQTIAFGRLTESAWWVGAVAQSMHESKRTAPFRSREPVCRVSDTRHNLQVYIARAKNGAPILCTFLGSGR